MRSLAGALEVTATALYWHVSTKEDVLDLAFDHIFGARTEFLQSALSRGGLTGVHLAVTTRLLANHVIGAALTEATYRRTPDSRTRLDVRRHITADPVAFPTLNASGHLDANRWNDDELFERGLDAILATATDAR